MILRSRDRMKAKVEGCQSIPRNGEFGFVILCPSLDKAPLRHTVNSIKKLYPNASILCVVGNDATKSIVQDFNELCPTIVANDTITSLMNVGIKNSSAIWNVLIFSGTWVQPSVQRQFDSFVKNDKDILFQIVNGYDNFVEGSMNGIILNKNTFLEVGDFPESKINKPGFKEMELMKLLWAISAIEKGCQFKGIIGMNVG